MPNQEHHNVLRNLERNIQANLNETKRHINVHKQNTETSNQHLSSIDTGINSIDTKVSTEAKQNDMITELVDIKNDTVPINAQTFSIDSKISKGSDFTLVEAQQVLTYGEVTSGVGAGELHPIHITQNGDVEVAIADIEKKGQELMADSFPVVIASDQSNLNTKLIGEDYLAVNRNVKVDTNGKLIVQVDGVRQNGSETLNIPDGSTGTSSEIQMGTYKYIAFYGDTDNTTNTNIFIEYSQDGTNWYRGAGDNAKIIIVSATGNFYDEEHVTPPRIRISRPNTSGSAETLQLYYTLL